MATNISIHDTIDSRMHYEEYPTAKSSSIVISTTNLDSVAIFLPSKPKDKHAFLTKLRLVIAQADEAALTAIVEENAAAMRGRTCHRCGHDTDVHHLDQGDAHPCSRSARGRICDCYDFVPTEPVPPVLRADRP